MNLLLIPIAVFMGIVALLILKEIKPDTILKKVIKLLIMITFIAAFALIAHYMSEPTVL